MMIIILIFLCLLSGFKAASQDADVCRDLDFDGKAVGHLASALEAETVDLIIMLDVSGSITPSNTAQMVGFMADFLLFASVVPKLQITPDRTRVTIILFDEHALPQQAALADSKITGCELQYAMSTLQFPQRDRRTYIGNGTAEAINLFRRWARERKVQKQVLIILTDGEFNDSPEELELARTSLSNHEVDVITVGIGDQLNDYQDANNLRTLASNDFHAKCLYVWRHHLVPNRKYFQPGPAVWYELPTSSQEICYAEVGEKRQCSTKAVCACDVAWPQFDCACQQGYYLDDRSQLCTRCAAGTEKPGIGNNQTLCQPTVTSGSGQKKRCLGLVYSIDFWLLITLIPFVTKVMHE